MERATIELTEMDQRLLLDSLATERKRIARKKVNRRNRASELAAWGASLKHLEDRIALVFMDGADLERSK